MTASALYIRHCPSDQPSTLLYGRRSQPLRRHELKRRTTAVGHRTMTSEGVFYFAARGHLHREDGPAVERVDGTREWWLNGKRHREDGPAVEYANGTRHWYLNGWRHREDGPAVENIDGSVEWWCHGRDLHQ